MPTFSKFKMDMPPMEEGASEEDEEMDLSALLGEEEEIDEDEDLEEFPFTEDEAVAHLEELGYVVTAPSGEEDDEGVDEPSEIIGVN